MYVLFVLAVCSMCMYVYPPYMLDHCSLLLVTYTLAQSSPALYFDKALMRTALKHNHSTTTKIVEKCVEFSQCSSLVCMALLVVQCQCLVGSLLLAGPLFLVGVLKPAGVVGCVCVCVCVLGVNTGVRWWMINTYLVKGDSCLCSQPYINCWTVLSWLFLLLSLHIHHGILISSGSGLVLNGIGVSIEGVRW